VDGGGDESSIIEKIQSKHHVLVIGVPSFAFPSWSWPSFTPRPHFRAHIGTSSEVDRSSKGRRGPPRAAAVLLLDLVVVILLAAMAINSRGSTTPTPPMPATTVEKQRGST